MPTTAAPISIYFTSGAQPESSENESATQASSIHAQFAMRERYDYMWANSTERGAQTGMVQGSRGYQIDTKTEYLFDGGSWRLSTPYAEYNSASVTVPNNAYTNIGALTYQSGSSTSSTFTSAVGNYVELVDPGVYGFSYYSATGGGIGLAGQSHSQASTNADPNIVGDQLSRGYFSSGARSMLPMPFYFCAAAGQRIYFAYFQSSGSSQTISGVLRIGRFA